MNACFTDLFFVPKGMVVNESEPESLFSRVLFNPKNHFATMPEDRDRFLSRALLKRGRGLLVHTDWANFYPTHDYYWLKPLPFIQEHIDEVKAVLETGLIVGEQTMRCPFVIRRCHSSKIRFEMC